MKDKNNFTKYINYTGRVVAFLGALLAILKIIPHNSLIQYVLIIIGIIIILLSSE